MISMPPRVRWCNSAIWPCYLARVAHSPGWQDVLNGPGRALYAGVEVEFSGPDTEHDGPRDPAEHPESAQHDAGDRQPFATFSPAPDLGQSGRAEAQREHGHDKSRHEQKEPQQELNQAAH